MGSGRSGTSMVAGSLRDAGYFMGERLYEGTGSNPKGYFEDPEINDVNERLLATLLPPRPRTPITPALRARPAEYQRWLGAIPLGTRPAATPDLAARIEALVAREPFAFKDPRFCSTLPAWRPHLPEDAVCICVFREPARTANSIVTETRVAPYLRDIRVTYRRALRVWTLAYRHVLEEHRFAGRWLFVHFDQFLDGSAIPAIEEALGAPVDRSFADPGLKRSEDDGRVPADTARVYRQLCALAAYEPGRSLRGTRVGS